MRSLLLSVVLSASAGAGMAGPADGRAASVPLQGREPVTESGRAAQNKDQRRAALREALVQRQDAAPVGSEGAPGRQLSPAERAELRRQLRDQSTR
ncbi:hypothetical protein [Rhodoferax sp.]|uniref:hypothetical protein n=1 Tax=Rhodoferax sp. TaxID=50421 RepID=UPI002ACED1DF|nr:hypothetical protein [Rhodoferax sp.]MDZ7918738.1 hypothetical protein [Rhodoferax sp.]